LKEACYRNAGSGLFLWCSVKRRVDLLRDIIAPVVINDLITVSSSGGKEAGVRRNLRLTLK